MRADLQKKIDTAIRLLQSVAPTNGEAIEVAYSGGKDSDVILQLVKESGIKYRAIYKNTTIDAVGTVAHAKEMGAEVLMPRDGLTFFKLIEQNGLPNRFMRFCCKYLKEYKVLDKAVMGIRRAESRKRSERYSEPTQCKFYGANKDHVEAIYPILDWTDKDVEDFIKDRKIKCAPIYYDLEGNFHVERRLGCMCCPLASLNKRLEQFKEHPNMVKAYARALKKFRDTHPDSKSAKNFKNEYEQLVRDFFFESNDDWELWIEGLFGRADCKKYLEDYFNIKF